MNTNEISFTCGTRDSPTALDIAHFPRPFPSYPLFPCLRVSSTNPSTTGPPTPTIINCKFLTLQNHSHVAPQANITENAGFLLRRLINMSALTHTRNYYSGTILHILWLPSTCACANKDEICMHVRRAFYLTTAVHGAGSEHACIYNIHTC